MSDPEDGLPQEPTPESEPETAPGTTPASAC
jgi:hypothetical protein